MYLILGFEFCAIKVWFLVFAVDVRSSGADLGLVKTLGAAVSSYPVSVSALIEVVSDDLQRLNKNLQSVSYLWHDYMIEFMVIEYCYKYRHLIYLHK